MSLRKNFIIALFIAFGAILISYFSSNLSFMGWQEKSLLSRTDLVRRLFNQHENSDNDNVIFIDVTYDKELRTLFEDDEVLYQESEAGDVLDTGIERIILGNTQITDRVKLLELLNFLDKTNDYKYILLDIIFSADIDSSKDSLLFKKIVEMRDIIIPRHADMKLADNSLYAKSGIADYSNLYIETDFIKYPFWVDNEKSIPLIMYENIKGTKLKNYGWITTDGGLPARKSIPLPLDVRMTKKIYENDGNIYEEEGLDILLLGRDILGMNSEDNEYVSSLLKDEPGLFKDKYVIIGSLYGDDLHSTYIGDMPGALILYNAFLSLDKRRHIINIPILIILYLIFFLISFTILSHKEMLNYLQQKKRKTKNNLRKKGYAFLKFLINNFAIETTLAIICVVIYLISGEIFDIIVTGIYFIIISIIVKNQRNFKLLKIFRTRNEK